MVELMVALTLGLIVTGAVIAMFIQSSQTYSTQNSYARLQENARFALSTMDRNIRMAGYRGCLGGKNDTSIPVAVTNTIVNPTSNLNAFGSGLQGYEATGSSAWSPALDTAISSASPAPSSGSDILTVRMGTGSGIPVSSAMANATVDIPVTATTGLAVGSNALVADCVASTVFQVTALNAGPTLSHTVSGSTNTTANLGRAFGVDAVVMPISTITFYVGPSSNAPTGTEKSLWQMVDGTSTELIDGVEDMQILYGEDTNKDLAPDHYVTADNVVNMDNVIAIRLNFLLRTIEDNVATSTQKYTFNGVPNITPTDKRIRRAFNMTISLRNRTN